jgi:hypothetical protein
MARRTEKLRVVPDHLASSDDEVDESVSVIPTDEAVLFWSRRRHPSAASGEAR